MAMIEKRAATRSDLKWFGLIIAACLGVLGAMIWHKGHHRTAIGFWSAGGLLAVIYYSIKSLQHLMYNVWMTIFYPVGFVISNVVVFLAYFLVLTPMGLLMRAVGRDPMQRAFDRAATSYWVEHDPSAEPARYFRQF